MVVVVVTLMVLRITAATTFVVASVVVSSTGVVAVLASGRFHRLIEDGVVVASRHYGIVVLIRRHRSVRAVATPVRIVAAIPRIDVMGVVGTAVVSGTLLVGRVAAAFGPRVASRLAITRVLGARATVQGLRLR